MARYIDMDKYPDIYPAEPDDMVSDAFSVGYYSCLKIIKEMQAEDVAPVVHSNWRGVNPFVDTIECCNCEWQEPSHEFATRYCSYCGATMDNYKEVAQFGLPKMEVIDD